ncbi:hypothetical protein HYV81_06060 [Candidatus Woesearchaeota archaeon]|nr:hypothetical protein [Candidatus Woesearchaeota archaeon]
MKSEFELPDEDLLLRDASPEFYFHLSDGRVLRNVNDLLQALKSMSEHVYHHHVNAHRNDFSTWIRDIFGDYNVAHKALSAKGRHELISILEKELIRENLEKSNEESKIRIKIKNALSRAQMKGREALGKQGIVKRILARSMPSEPTDKLAEERAVLAQLKELEQAMSAKLSQAGKQEQEMHTAIARVTKLEERLHRKMEEVSGQQNSIFTKEFVQGLIVGAVIVGLLGIVLRI